MLLVDTYLPHASDHILGHYMDDIFFLLRTLTYSSSYIEISYKHLFCMLSFGLST
ncbi:hypothetical protein L208DRAFT_54389 [Tricholoma matsutake]|nr:hypothetical protein L208DRAFT_54389 [Tricholoma matsutake 945]